MNTVSQRSQVSQVSQALQWVLETFPSEIERSTGFVQRSSARLDGPRFVKSLVLAWMNQADASYFRLTAFANGVGAGVSPQAVEQRFTPQAVTVFQQVFEQATLQVICSQSPRMPELFARFQGIYLQDGTIIRLPPSLAQAYPRRRLGAREGDPGSLRIQARLEWSRGILDGLWAQASYLEEGAGVAQSLSLPPRSLFVADVQYLKLAQLQQRQRDGTFWLSGFKTNLALFTQQGVRIDLGSWQQQVQQPGQQGQLVVDQWVFVGLQERVPCRLIAVWKDLSEASQPPGTFAPRDRKGIQYCRPGHRPARSHSQRQSRSKHHDVGPGRQKLAGWMFLLTNVSAEQMSVQEARVLMRVRWQLELLWKLWKQDGKIDAWRSSKSERIEVEIYAKLIGLVLVHWQTVIGCWEQIERSLRKAQQVCQISSFGLLLALEGELACERVIERIQLMMQGGYRVDSCRKKPSTYQLLRNPALISS